MQIKPLLATISQTPNWYKVPQMLERKRTNTTSIHCWRDQQWLHLSPLWKTIHHLMTQQELCWVYTHSQASQPVFQALESLRAKIILRWHMKRAWMRPLLVQMSFNSRMNEEIYMFTYISTCINTHTHTQSTLQYDSIYVKFKICKLNNFF